MKLLKQIIENKFILDEKKDDNDSKTSLGKYKTFTHDIQIERIKKFRPDLYSKIINLE